MTINRANQTWPEDVTTNLWEKVANKIQGRLIAQLPKDAQEQEIERLNIYKKYAPEPESEMEYERRQRGSASTIAAVFVVALFIVFAVAVMPLINSLGVK